LQRQLFLGDWHQQIGDVLDWFSVEGDSVTYYTEKQVREALHRKMENFDTQRQAAKDAEVKPQHLSQAINGGGIYGKLLQWLGYEPVKLYRRVK